MPYVVVRSGMCIGTKAVGDAFHVEHQAPGSEEPIASFWINAKQSPVVAKERAEKMADGLNTKRGRKRR